MKNADTIFTPYAFVGDFSAGYNHIHKDINDLISFLLTLETNAVSGRSTCYFSDRNIHMNIFCKTEDGLEVSLLRCTDKKIRIVMAILSQRKTNTTL